MRNTVVEQPHFSNMVDDIMDSGIDNMMGAIVKAIVGRSRSVSRVTSSLT